MQVHRLHRRDDSVGFTLVELLIGITVLGILLGLALPSFSDMLRNSKVRSTAETILFGIQLARSEALKRNVPVSFALVESDPTTIASASPVFATTLAGQTWVVYSDDGSTRELIDSRTGAEVNSNGSQVVNVVTQFPGLPTAAATRLTFDTLGRPSELVNAAQLDFAAAGFACQAEGGPVRCLRIVVTQAGSVRLCDPKLPTGAVPPATSPDPRACPI